MKKDKNKKGKVVKLHPDTPKSKRGFAEQDPIIKDKKLRGKPGRPGLEITEEQRKRVRLLLAVGTTQEQCADYLKIARMSFKKHFAEEIASAAMEVNSSVAGALYKNCMSGNVIAQIFWCKTRMGWREIDRTDEAAGPIKIVFQNGNTPDSDRNKIEE